MHHFVHGFEGLSWVTPEVRQIFASYDWPGNVRGLENVIEGQSLLDEHDQDGHPPEGRSKKLQNIAIMAAASSCRITGRRGHDDQTTQSTSHV